MSIKDVFQFFAVIGLVCVGWLACENHINPSIIHWNRQWIGPMDQLYAIVALYTLIGIFSIAYVYNHVKKKAHLSYWGWIIWILLTLIYSNYRWNKFTPFIFWEYKGWVWLDIIYVLGGIFVLYEIIYLIRLWKQEKKVILTEGILLRDDAIEDLSEGDFLEYNDMATELKTRLEAVNLSKKSYSVGIVGEWGIGKSSLLNLFANQVKQAGQIVVRFNPRSAKKVDLIQEEFFAVLTHELNKYNFNASKALGKYAYALNLHSSTKWIYAIWDWFADWTSESEKNAINTIIRNTGKKIYVIIEDLDRLTGLEILEVLKLIDANGNFCNTVFLTAYDKTYVNGVLKAEIKYADEKTDFTDKYFQYELMLFKQPIGDVYGFLYTNLVAWVKEKLESEEDKRKIETGWATHYRQILNQITTIRQAKRYVNLFRYTYTKVDGKVDFVDFALVTLIRYFDNDAYYDLYSLKYLTNRHMVFSTNGSYILHKDYKDLAHSDKLPNLHSILETLFPEEGSVRQFDSEYNRINRVESFVNYFYSKVKGKLYYGDMNLMMNAETLDGAIKKFDDYLAQATQYPTAPSIVEFLITREASWIRTKERLERYMCLLIYALERIPREGRLTAKVNEMLIIKTREPYMQYMTADEYKEIVLSAFATMQQYTPYIIGTYMALRLKEKYANSPEDNSIYIDGEMQAQQILEESQRAYDGMFGKSYWTAANSVELGLAIEGETDEQGMERREQLKRMMDEHPDEYGRAMLMVQVYTTSDPHTFIYIKEYDKIEKMYGFEELKVWAKTIEDEDLRYLFELLLKNKENGGYANERIEQIIEHPKENISKVVQLLKQKYAGLSYNQRKRLDYIIQRGGIAWENYRDHFRLSKATFVRDMRKFVETGYLEQKQENGRTMYIVNKQ